MQDFQQRVVDEMKALDDKISRLSPFIESERFKGLPDEEQERMERQLHHMQQYSRVLRERIEAFTP